MSARNKVRRELLRFREARLLAMSPESRSRGVGENFERPRLMSRLLQSRESANPGTGSEANPRASPGVAPGDFTPKVPILDLFMGGSRPLRELGRNLLQSTQLQPQEEDPREEPAPPRVCPECGALNLPGSKFCANCGVDLEAPRASQFGRGESSTMSLEI